MVAVASSSYSLHHYHPFSTPTASLRKKSNFQSLPTANSHGQAHLRATDRTTRSNIASPIAKMQLKRKRSDSELSFSSVLSSPPRPSTLDFGAMDTDCRRPFVLQVPTPSHLHSRTMKRHRDNRPSEAEVHRMSSLLVHPRWFPS